ncbi:MAG: DNA polymerase III subunit beta [Candidatus Coatesbacteria bacterium]|nr:DNA polymerase III subunit beta [Candidatus Coatesbacteria bacterium]
MKFTTNKIALVKALNKVAAVSTRTAVDDTLYVLLETVDNMLNLTATDLQVTMRVEQEVIVMEEGRLAVNTKRLLEIVKELPTATVELSANEEQLEINCESSHFLLNGLSSEEFLRLPAFNPSVEIGLPSKTLIKMLDKTVFCVSKNESRPEINGVLFDIHGKELRVVSTDSRRFAFTSLSGTYNLLQDPTKIVILPKVLTILIKEAEETEEITLGFNDRYLMFKYDNVQLFSLLHDHPYPEYERVIPNDNTNIAKMNRDALLGATKRMNVLSSIGSSQMTLEFNQNELKLFVTSEETGTGDDRIPINYTGENLKIGFNSSFLISLLPKLDNEEIKWEMGGPLKASIIRPMEEEKDLKYYFLLMPLKLPS